MTPSRHRSIPPVLALLALLATEPLLAGSVRVAFEGTVTSTLSITEIASGSRLHGWFTYDPTVADSNPADGALGLYPAVGAAEVEVAGHRYRTGHGTISVMNDAVIDPRNPRPLDLFGLNAGPPLAGDALSGLPPFQLEINLADTSASVFDSDRLPAKPPAASRFDIRSLGPSGTAGGRLLFRSAAKPVPGAVQFSVDRLEVKP